MLPNVSKPVRRPEYFRTDLQLVFLGIDQSGHDKWIWELATGANPDPDEPQHFLEWMACSHWSALFSRTPTLACARGRRR